MKWLNDMKDIKNKNKVNIIDIKMFIQSNIRMTEKLESEIQIIESIDIFDSLFNNLLKTDQKLSIIDKNIHKYVENVIYMISDIIQQNYLNNENDRNNQQLAITFRNVYDEFNLYESKVNEKMQNQSKVFFSNKSEKKKSILSCKCLLIK